MEEDLPVSSIQESKNSYLIEESKNDDNIYSEVISEGHVDMQDTVKLKKSEIDLLEEVLPEVVKSEPYHNS